MTRSEIHARLLGPLELQQGELPMPLGRPAQRALLARLLLDANRTVAVDRLVDDLWGEDAPASAVKMIQIHVSKLRKVLPGAMLVTRPPGYAVEIQPEAVDLVRFDRLRKEGRAALAGGSAEKAADRLRDALALWRGPALAEFDEPFAVVESARLEELHLACTEDRIDADLALGRHAVLVGELEAHVARNQLRERPRGQLMLALYRSGRQAEALAGYRELRKLLSAELGIEPSPALRTLEQRMLLHDPALEPTRVERRHRRSLGHTALRSPHRRRATRRGCALAAM
jgi:DNA-binding SARP family transcriptional activator